jgi:hypothetical protein
MPKFRPVGVESGRGANLFAKRAGTRRGRWALFSNGYGSLLQYSVKGGDVDNSSLGTIADQDLKGRYYYDKSGFTPFDAQKHIALHKANIEGLVWNLKYYYEGCVSWEWYYLYHYGKKTGMEILLLSNMVGKAPRWIQ